MMLIDKTPRFVLVYVGEAAASAFAKMSALRKNVSLVALHLTVLAVRRNLRRAFVARVLRFTARPSVRPFRSFGA